jgi:RNA recognition motif-containing protein
MGTRLFVGNLSFSATEDGLRDCFAADGRQVASVRIMLDRETGRSRGFAFVDMANEADAKAAIVALDGVDFDGRPLRVNEATERPERPAGARPPRREGGDGPPRFGSGGGQGGPRSSGPGGGARRFDDPPRGGRPDARRGERGPDRPRDDAGGRKSRRPRDDDDDDNEWE